MNWLADDKMADYVPRRQPPFRPKRIVLAKAFRGELVPTEADLARREARPYDSAAALLACIRAALASGQVSATGRRKNKGAG